MPVYKHHIAQNSSISYNRRLEIDAYNLDWDADFVHVQEVKPVVQFIYEIDFGFAKRSVRRGYTKRGT